jgi:cytosine/adenosine deaminase-related metal-dependent hydrolase
MNDAPIGADLLFSGATIITLNAERHVLEDGALAICGDRIVAVGKREDIEPTVEARRCIDARRFVLTPGFVDGHIHVTGDPLTRGFVRGTPGDSSQEILQRWVIPIFRAQTADDERIAAQCAALAMIRNGTTCFVEAGTILQLDAVIEGLTATGIRGRVGQWVEGRVHDPDVDQIRATDTAIATLESEIARYPDDFGNARLAAWPLLVGHSTNSDDVWRAAKILADEQGLRMSAHMSPSKSDPDWFWAKYGRRPLEHLNDIGVLGPNVMLTHLASIDPSELSILAQTGTNAIHCPLAALRGGFGISHTGLFPEMLNLGVNVLVGTDGLATDVLSSARLLADVFRDARGNRHLFPASTILDLAILHPARAMGLSEKIGSLEVGKKADLVLHDTDLPEWGPMFDCVRQLALSAAPSGVHSVWIDGVQVLDDGHALLFDEARLLADSRRAGKALIARTCLPTGPCALLSAGDHQ